MPTDKLGIISRAVAAFRMRLGLPPPQRMTPVDTVESAHKGKRGLRRIVNAFYYSMSGLKLAYKHEHAFRQELLGAVVLLPIACLVPVTPVERVLLVGTVLLVLIVELLNSSIEAAVDRVGPRDASPVEAGQGCRQRRRDAGAYSSRYHVGADRRPVAASGAAWNREWTLDPVI